jgi:hypothetical protein
VNRKSDALILLSTLSDCLQYHGDSSISLITIHSISWAILTRIFQTIHKPIHLRMNFYKECATILARLEEKKGSIKSLVGTMPEKDRKRAAALVIETLKCNKLLKVKATSDCFRPARFSGHYPSIRHSATRTKTTS